MAITNTETRYGSISKGFHWLTALLILTLLPLGLIANWLPYETDAQLAQKAWLFSLHKTLGVSAFLVAVLRILWALSQAKPGLLNADKPAESFAAELVHWLLYAALVIVPLSGWISHAAAAGFAPIWWPFGQGLPLVPKSTGVEHVFGALHWIATKVLALSLALHIAGALKHHVIDRDATLRRMLPGEPVIGPLPAQTHSKTPVLAASLVWAMVIAAGSVMGTTGKDTARPDVALADVTSQWRVQDGSIAITVVQFGNEVSGSFVDWTAAIQFDETIPDGEVGHVTTTIAVPSLTLGSVTQQAMGADFFDAETYATAVYDGVIRHGIDGYEAAGTLTIKDRSVPLVMPFGLAVNGDVAEMRADLTLDRRDFGIGDNVGDEGSLAFAVKLAVKLTATRAPEE
ncbi:cytochrome [Sulfitobacter sp. M57]|uniref:cytochrome b/b6 domain-containing protein n=1 Tax=unclassified Sulfitobacter TaxID=196795 RepID=UPI0023E1EBF9|nr:MULTISPECIES: cytochrome b/b6 domain-containing protein [unclassified Sulfitobacter]MDF3413426.1 cytochrome [Sulfitobacter sp. KE5]MDF3421294.1 cytochrome [Sulfitobacter sp. KE43]MDF3431973.1 cytochrome [Sulfitobacter sp. KE42]MDF3457613.1 cytochrome [Sulfitobacter sp. S74]MDF3461515.1 cytochrome [Sulfitobacter sp. Ks18]